MNPALGCTCRRQRGHRETLLPATSRYLIQFTRQSSEDARRPFSADMSNIKPAKRRKNVYTILLSVCLFLGVICACLLVALVLIGKNLALQKQCSDNVNPNLQSNNDSSSKRDKSEDNSEISVKIHINDKKDNAWPSGWRLPKDVQPLNYDVYLVPNFIEGVFTGRNNITINLKDRRNHLIVHSNLLNITTVRLFDGKGNEIEVLDHHADLIHQLHVVDLDDSLQPGLFYLYFEFGGNLTNRVGFYRSSYHNEAGEQR